MVFCLAVQCAMRCFRVSGIDLFCVKQGFDTSDNAYELIFFAQSISPHFPHLHRHPRSLPHTNRD